MGWKCLRAGTDKGMKVEGEGSVNIFYRQHNGCFHCGKKTERKPMKAGASLKKLSQM